MASRSQTKHPTSQPAMPVLALLSNDAQLTETVQSVASQNWSVLQPAVAELPALVREPNVRLVIFDDQSVPVSDRGWTLSEIRRVASRASIIYVAGEHDHENERQARSRGILFYTAKPVVADHISLLLQQLLKMRNGHP